MKYHELKTKKDRISFLKTQLSTQATWALRGLVRIYEYQTASEQSSMTTHVHNGVGFSGADAEILSSYAEQYKRKGTLTEKQLAILLKKMPKYARQLDAIAQTKQ